MHAARWFAYRLEHGDLVPSFVKPVARAYAAFAAPRLARPVHLPDPVPIVGIGGAVLGGSGKTLVAIAYARALAHGGAKVALVSHGYRSSVGEPRLCTGNEPVHDVGDDTLVAARALESDNVAVWVGADRGRTLRAAAMRSDVVVVDGLLQTRPRRLARSVLVLDADEPWGAGECPPLGDLRAPPQGLLSVSDEVVLLRDVTCAELAPDAEIVRSRRPCRVASLDVVAVGRPNSRTSLKSIASRRLGLLTMMARPHRVMASLQARGVRPVDSWQGPDHGRLSPRDMRSLRMRAKKYGLDAWLATTKCVTHLEDLDLGIEVMTLECTTRLDSPPQPVLDSRPCVPQKS